MYSHCIFCRSDLGGNEAVETFPVGRRLAFDAEKGRLWVVCARCSRWNLSPFEERWEAVESCERLYRGARQRVSTENIGLVRAADGTELVRIGRPLRPEFAAWRYGRQFDGRLRRSLVGFGLSGAAVAALYLAPGLLISGAAAVPVANLGVHLYGAARRKLRKPLVLRSRTGGLIRMDADWAGYSRLRLTGEGTQEWELEVMSGPINRLTTLEGEEAVAAAAQILPYVNRYGANRRDLREAVAELESVSDPKEYFPMAERRARKKGRGYGTLSGLPKPIRLALEMAANEDNERLAIEGELHLLEQAWRDAEEIAKIADGLLIPPETERFIEQHRGGSLTSK